MAQFPTVRRMPLQLTENREERTFRASCRTRRTPSAHPSTAPTQPTRRSADKRHPGGQIPICRPLRAFLPIVLQMSPPTGPAGRRIVDDERARGQEQRPRRLPPEPLPGVSRAATGVLLHRTPTIRKLVSHFPQTATLGVSARSPLRLGRAWWPRRSVRSTES